jgi:lysophospholipase L1-like esterase
MTGEASRRDAQPSRVLRPAPPQQRSTRRRLKALAAAVPDRADVILLGDSLAAGWPACLWHESFPGKAVFNFGVPGERVQNTLWRLEAIATGHLAPRWAIILLGTNNLGDADPPDAIAAGLSAVAERVRQLWREPLILLFTIPPRGPSPRFREHDRIRVNALLAATWTGDDRHLLLDADLALGSAALDGTAFESDRLHLSRAGYELLTLAFARCVAGRA